MWTAPHLSGRLCVVLEELSSPPGVAAGGVLQVPTSSQWRDMAQKKVWREERSSCVSRSTPPQREIESRASPTERGHTRTLFNDFGV